MITILWILVLFVYPILINSLIFHRLSTNGQQQLKKDDYVYSTLGQFRLSLQQKTCQLRIQQFSKTSNQNIYRTVGYYPRISNSQQCKYIKLNQTGLYTSFNTRFSNLNYLSLSKISHNLTIQRIKQSFLTIDDIGVIRLQISYNDYITTEILTKQKWITRYRNPKKYIYPTNNNIISLQSTLSLIKNNANWGFSAKLSQLKIFLLSNINMNTKYKYPSLIISSNLFKDITKRQIPLIDLQGIKYQEKCGKSKQIYYRTPYVFVINQYWPQLRVLDQDGYELINIRYPYLNCINNIGVREIKQSNQCVSWVCPKELFEINGKCVSKCPQPYFHQIGRNKKNRCVIMCEAGSFMDNQTRICSCEYNSFIDSIKCPKQLNNTPFGCLCLNNKFFSSLNLDSTNLTQKYSLKQLCLPKCPQRYYQHHQGICVSCPIFCIKCIEMKMKIMYLQCKQCQQGYEVENGYCKKKCSQMTGSYVDVMNKNNGKVKDNLQMKCKKCTINFCKKCVAIQSLNNNNNIGQFQQKCLSCILPYTLLNNKCQSNCPRNQYILKFTQIGSFECIPIKKCDQILTNSINSINSINLGDSKLVPLLTVNTCKNCDFYYNSCMQSCENNISFFHNISKCFCQQNNTLSYINGCNYTFQHYKSISSYNTNTSLFHKKQIQKTYSNFLNPQFYPCKLLQYYYNYKTNQCLCCPFGCLTCVVNQQGQPECTSCTPGYYLLFVLEGSYCQKQTSLVKPYYYNAEKKYGFYWQNLIQNDNFHKQCKKINKNCLYCLLRSNQYCMLCQDGYYLLYGKCLSQCPSNYYPYDNQPICLPFTIPFCSIQKISFITFLIPTNITTQYIQGYRYFTTKLFTYITNQNDPIGIIFTYYGILSKKINSERISIFEKAKSICKKCHDGYGLTQKGVCKKCKENCLICIYPQSNLCIRCHPFYYINQENQCIPYTEEKKPCIEGQYRNQKGYCQKSCKKYYKITTKSLQANNDLRIINCSYNCPNQMLIYKSNQKNVLICMQKILTAKSTIMNKQNDQDIQIKLQKITNINSSKLQSIVNEPIKLMGSCYKSGIKNKCILIPTVKIKNVDPQKVSISNAQQLLQSSNNINKISRTLQSSNQSDFPSLSSAPPLPYFIHSLPQKNLLIIQFTNFSSLITAQFQLLQFSNPQKNQFLGNSLYGLQINQQSTLSMLESILKNDYGMHYYARALIIMFLLIMIINLGKGLDYKIDNLWITMNVTYLVFLGLDLNINQGSYHVYGWMYSFAWTTGLEMFANPRKVTYNQMFFSENYLQKVNNNAHYLLYIDDNFIKNCWSIIILLIIIIGFYALSWIITKYSTKNNIFRNFKNNIRNFFKNKQSQEQINISQTLPQQQEKLSQQKIIKKKIQRDYQKTYSQQDFNHLTRIRQFTFFIIQSSIPGLLYYILLQISSLQWQLTQPSQLNKHKTIAWIFFIIIIFYTIFRSINNFIAGVYLFKRMLLVVVLWWRPVWEGEVKLFFSLFAVEILFCAMRFYFQCRNDLVKFIRFIKTINQNKGTNNTNKDSKNNDKPQINLQRQFLSKSENKFENNFQFQRAKISSSCIMNIQQKIDQSKSLKNTIKDTTSPSKIKQNNKAKKTNLWQQISSELKNLIIEQILILIVYLSACVNHNASSMSILLSYLVFLVFLIIFVDQLIVNLIEYSEIRSKTITEQNLLTQFSNNNIKNSALELNLNVNLKPYYFKIRNNFDYQSQEKIDSFYQTSEIFTKQRKSSIS